MSGNNNRVALLDSGAAFDPALSYASDIVTAFVSRNAISASELPALIRNVHAAIAGLSAAPAPAELVAETVEKASAAQIRKSITADAIVSFLDGKPYKTLKRHLTTHGLQPHTYRQRFGLPDDYPMVAPNYAAQRSALAKQIGLGRGGVCEAPARHAVAA